MSRVACGSKMLFVIGVLGWSVGAVAQTFDYPVVISVEPASAAVRPGQDSALLVNLKIPHGFLIGTGNRAERNPAATVVDIEPVRGFHFAPVRFPAATKIAVPVHRGQTSALAGEIRLVVPFRTDSDLAAGEYEVVVRLTYTPALAAGHLRSHVREPYAVKVRISAGAKLSATSVPEPSAQAVPVDFAVVEHIKELPQPLKLMMHRWDEDGLVARFLHTMWLDPPNHGKHVQTAWVPFFTFSEKSGNGVGISVELVNATREGIMTGFLQIRGYDNEYIGTTGEIKAISCPDAYYNYQASAELSRDGKNKQLHFHTEHLGVGRDQRYGYEMRFDFSHDPRARFHGMGAATTQDDKTNYSHQENGGVIDVYALKENKWRLGIGGKYRQVNVADGSEALHREIPWTTDETGPGGRLASVPGIQGATVAGARALAVYDSRNSEFAASDGSYVKLTAEVDWVTDQVVTTANPVSRYARYSLDMRKYKSTIDQNLTFVVRSLATFTTSDEIPFFDQAQFGGEFSDRGFVQGRYYGQNSAFASMEMRYLVMRIGVLGMPMEIEMAPFLDVGQVFAAGNFDGPFNVNPGLSLRMLNKPNVGIVSNGAFGRDGFILTGGVELPF